MFRPRGEQKKPRRSDGTIIQSQIKIEPSSAPASLLRNTRRKTVGDTPTSASPALQKKMSEYETFQALTSPDGVAVLGKRLRRAPVLGSFVSSAQTSSYGTPNRLTPRNNETTDGDDDDDDEDDRNGQDEDVDVGDAGDETEEDEDAETDEAKITRQFDSEHRQFSSEYDQFQALASPGSPVVLGKRRSKARARTSSFREVLVAGGSDDITEGEDDGDFRA